MGGSVGGAGAGGDDDTHLQQQGGLWCSLATYHIQMGHFDHARDVYEEALEKVNTVADFSQVFDAYAQLEESLISVQMEALQQSGEGGDGGDDYDEDDGDADMVDGDRQDGGSGGKVFTDRDDLNMRFARLEHLMARRPFLLSSVKLRQNPHNVHEWHRRVKLFQQQKDLENVVATYVDATAKVDPRQASGKPHTLWCAFAKFYEFKLKDADSARIIYQKAVQVDYRTVEELAAVWCDWVEMELRLRNYRQARALLLKATARPPKKAIAAAAAAAGISREQRTIAEAQIAIEEQGSIQHKLHRSVKLWSLYLDVEESLGSVEQAMAAYERCLELKVATVPMLLNYANYLEERKYYEHAFRVYEKGVALFTYPQAHHLWVNYVTKFVARYAGDKLERARDLFEQAIEKVPEEFAKGLYLLYAKFEEDFGLAKHAMSVYERALRAVAEEERFAVFLVYVTRASEFYGITRTRELYEKAIETLPEGDVPRACLLYARLERQLGEVDRARVIYAHGARLVNPSPAEDEHNFWKTFEEFEEKHGNVDTYTTFLRLRKSVLAHFSTANLATAAMEKAQQEFEERRRKMLEERKRQQREDQQRQRLEEEIAARQQAGGAGVEQAEVENEDRIELDEDVAADDAGNDDRSRIGLRAMPASLFERNVART